MRDMLAPLPGQEDLPVVPFVNVWGNSKSGTMVTKVE